MLSVGRQVQYLIWRDPARRTGSPITHDVYCTVTAAQGAGVGAAVVDKCGGGLVSPALLAQFVGGDVV